MNAKIIFIFIVFVYVCYVDGHSCSNGTCISVYDCPLIRDLLRKPNRTPKEQDQLKDSACGFKGTTALVCCPDQCYNPDGKPGSCVNIYKCPHLAKMLKTPYSRPDNVPYVMNSRCVGEDKHSVCCGPERTVANNLNTRCAGIINAFPPDPKTECCGKDSLLSNKITGGTTTSIEEYPWMALIEYIKNNGPVKTLCGGALISARYVLTAAHCVTGAILQIGTPWKVRLSEYDTSNPGKDCSFGDVLGDDCNDGTVIIPIEQTIPHPEYKNKRNKIWNDIALIRLKQSAPFTEFIRPICLPEIDRTFTTPINFTVAGWGAVSTNQSSSAIKLHVPVPYVETPLCQLSFPTSRLWDGQMCAGGLSDMDSCKGDSGGPLMYQDPEKRYYEVLGLVSYGHLECGIDQIPSVYTKVAYYKDWIINQIRR